MKNKFITLLIVILCLCSCSKTNNDTKYEKVEDLNGKAFSIQVGTIHEDVVEEFFPDSEKQIYSTSADTITAVMEGKAEALMSEGGYVRMLCEENEELTYFNEPLNTFEYGAIFPKTEEGVKAVEDFNSFLSDYKESGRLQEIYDKWFLTKSNEEIDYESLPNINGELKIASDGITYPFDFVSNGKVTGFEIELVYDYCKDRGFALKIDQCDFAAALAAVSTGKVNAAFSDVVYTEERAQSFIFSDLYASEETYVVIRKDKSAFKYNNLDDLEGQTVAVLSGGIGAGLVEKNIKDPEVLFYNSTADAVQALANDKVEALSISYLSSYDAIKDNKDIRKIGCVGTMDTAFILKKDNSSKELENKLNEFIKNKRADGTLDKLYDEWFNDLYEKHVDYDGLKDINGTLNVAVCSGIGGNICYYNENKLYGMDIETIVEFAKEYGYNVNFQDYDFSGLLAAVSSGKADIGASCISITEERKQSLTFTEPIYTDSDNVYVKAGVTNITNEGFVEGIVNSFEKTFIFDNRYELFTKGIGSTLLITFLSLIFGFIFGAILFYIFRKNNKIMNKVLDIYTWLINGMPTVVLLMVFFYIIFGKTKLSGMAVSIIAFTCVFSVSIMGLLKTCFMAIDNGQFEAGYALGYSKRDTIKKIIIPEIAPMFFPSFRADVISLLKSTSIVGYIAVQDLTKASDIVRSRTYEAFFPLIATTIIYFILGALINILIKYIEKKLDTKQRTQQEVLKGVNYHD